MENSVFSLIQQPKPEVSNANKNAPQPAKRAINRPKVGVVELAKSSSTPIADTLYLNRQENPKPEAPEPQKRKGQFSMKEVGSMTIMGCGGLALVKLFKRKHHEDT